VTESKRGGNAPGRTALAIAVLACASAVLCAWMLGGRLVEVFQIREHDRTIRATGSARMRVRSDLVIWTATVSARGETLAEAWGSLSKSTPRVRSFLVEHGVAEEEIVIHAVRTDELHPRNDEGFEIPEQVIGYRLAQTVEVTSSDIERITDVSRQVTELIEEGLVIESEPPDYLYTGLAELKVRLVEAASRDARARAEKIIDANGGRIVGLSSARMGVVQVNGANETEVTWEGVNDASERGAAADLPLAGSNRGSHGARRRQTAPRQGAAQLPFRRTSGPPHPGQAHATSRRRPRRPPGDAGASRGRGGRDRHGTVGPRGHPRHAAPPSTVGVHLLAPRAVGPRAATRRPGALR